MPDVRLTLLEQHPGWAAVVEAIRSRRAVLAAELERGQCDHERFLSVAGELRGLAFALNLVRSSPDARTGTTLKGQMTHA